MTLKLPKTGMAVTTDIGESHDIHPRNKQDVGKRLAAIALHEDYNKDIEFSGPVYKSMKVDGNKIIINFDHTGKGLEARDKYGYLKGFAIAGEDQKFKYAKAHIQGDHVVVYSDEVSSPVAVRYSLIPPGMTIYHPVGIYDHQLTEQDLLHHHIHHLHHRCRVRELKFCSPLPLVRPPGFHRRA